jgi:hypothetical protein
MANEPKLDVTPAALSSTGVTMGTVANHLQTIKDAIDREAGSDLPGVGLPFLSFSALGELARHRYQNNCETASERIGKLLADANDLKSGLAKNAVAYVGSEADLSAEIDKLNHKIEATVDPAVDASSSNIHTKDFVWSAGLAGAGGLFLQEAHKATVFNAALKAVENENWATFGENFLGSESRLIGTTEGVTQDAVAGDALLATSVSQDLSQHTAGVLKVAGSYSIAAFATGIAWAGSAIVRSDENLSTAASTWKQIGTAIYRIFNEEVADLKKALFAEWTSPETSAAAEKKISDFEKSGRDFADWVNQKMATSIDKVITDLNTLHTWAFGFACTQLAALLAFFIFPAWSQTIGVCLNATFTVVMNLIGMALGAFWLTPDVSA